MEHGAALGKKRPNSVIVVAKPTVLSVTVFPPAFGPVIIKPCLVGSNLRDRGTGLLNKGCFIPFN